MLIVVSGCDEQRWHVLLSEPQRERIAAARLESEGISSYVPLIIRRVLAKGRVRRLPGVHPRPPIRTKAQPMFPGYIFAMLPIDGSQERRAKDVDGIRDLLKICGVTATLTQNQIAFMREAAMAMSPRSDRQQRASLLAKFHKGQQVTMLEGAFAQMLAKIETLDARGRIGILMNLFGRTTLVECDPSEIVAA